MRTALVAVGLALIAAPALAEATVDDLLAFIPKGCVPVVVDIIEGATPLPEYQHPERAFYIFGPEDGTLDPALYGAVRDVVYVPTRGCMNLAASVNVILYDRLAKQHRA